MTLVADAASQSLVIGVGSATIAVLGLLMAAIYKVLDGTRDDIRTMRSDLTSMRSDLTGLASTMHAGFDRLDGDLSHLNREVGELKVRLEYVAGSPQAPPKKQGTRPASPPATKRTRRAGSE